MEPAPERFDRLSRLIRAHAPADRVGHAVGDGAIERYQRELGVALSGSYQCFLREFGFATWPEDIHGMVPAGTRGLNLIWNTEQERSEVEPAMPRHMVPFSPDGWGNHYCIDTSQHAGGECPVVLWDQEMDADQKPQQTHPSFVA